MKKILPWIILGGITPVAAILVFQAIGAVWYLRSPERVVKGAFARILNTKSFDVAIEAAEDTPNGLSFKVDGTLDKQQLAKPVAEISISFQAPDKSFYGSGQAKAKDGELYLRFDQISGIPGILPGALQSVWADLNMDALFTVGRGQLFPQATGSLTEEDLVSIKAIALNHIPFIPLGRGDSGWLGLVAVEHYQIGMDRSELRALVVEIKTAVKGEVLTDAENKEIAEAVAAFPTVSGEVWIARGDGTMRAAVLTAKKKDRSLRLNMRFSNYDRTISVEAPPSPQPLIELVRRLTGPTLGNTAIKLPFDIPVPIYDMNVKIPEISDQGQADTGKRAGSLPDLIRLFYGTDKLFAK